MRVTVSILLQGLGCNSRGRILSVVERGSAEGAQTRDDLVEDQVAEQFVVVRYFARFFGRK